ncbi:MAG: hypothetical protein RR232_08300 [Clostridia bacterium]
MKKAATKSNGPIKAQIYFARTYRRLQPNTIWQAMYILLCVLPCVVVFLLCYSHLTYLISHYISNLLRYALPDDTVLRLRYGSFLPYFGGVYFINVPTRLPTASFTLINLFVSLMLIILCNIGKYKGRPISVYLTIAITIHIISCIFFLFAAEHFPYSAVDYSEIYIEQQIGIWLSFIVIAGLVTGLISCGKMYRKLFTFLEIMAYSFVFGVVRYMVFLYVVCRFSSLYMASLFFSLGPFFDFLYLVYIYSVFIDRLISTMDTSTERGVWQWT